MKPDVSIAYFELERNLSISFSDFSYNQAFLELSLWIIIYTKKIIENYHIYRNESPVDISRWNWFTPFFLQPFSIGVFMLKDGNVQPKVYCPNMAKYTWRRIINDPLKWAVGHHSRRHRSFDEYSTLWQTLSLSALPTRCWELRGALLSYATSVLYELVEVSGFSHFPSLTQKRILK